MTIFGITGGSGAGKSTALRVLADMGALVIDCDTVYHEMLAAGGPMLEAIGTRFPGTVVAGQLQRKALGEIVFHHPTELAALNQITHSHVREEVARRIAAHRTTGGTLAAIEAIALIESGIATMCNIVIGILAPPNLRTQRLVTREGLEPTYAKARITSQKPDSFFQTHCDYILENKHQNQEAFITTCQERFKQLLSTLQ